jgi:hydroxymethylbilane synthase
VARIVIGTRGSPLALWQARHVASLLRARHSGIEIEEKIIHSDGDLDQASPIAGLGDTGVFVRRLEQALLLGQVDLAVHSLKDLPSDQPTGLLVAAVPERHDPSDALISQQGWTLSDLPEGARVGTGSCRRRSQLLHARPDLRISGVRGNVGTRLRKLKEGEFDALVLALAGVERLGIDDIEIRPLDSAICLPAVGQGALAIEARVDDRGTRELTEVLNHEASLAAITAERAFLRRLGGGCQAPASAFARFSAERLVVDCFAGDLDGRVLIEERETGEGAEAHTIGARLAERLLVAGAQRILDDARSRNSTSDG